MAVEMGPAQPTPEEQYSVLYGNALMQRIKAIDPSMWMERPSPSSSGPSEVNGTKTEAHISTHIFSTILNGIPIDLSRTVERDYPVVLAPDFPGDIVLTGHVNYNFARFEVVYGLEATGENESIVNLTETVDHDVLFAPSRRRGPVEELYQAINDAVAGDRESKGQAPVNPLNF